MRTTIDLPEKLIGEVMTLSKTRKKKEAVRVALEEYVKKNKIEKLLSLPGKIEITDVTSELEQIEIDEN